MDNLPVVCVPFRKLLLTLLLVPLVQCALHTPSVCASDDAEFTDLIQTWRKALTSSTGVEVKGIAAALAAANWDPWYKDGEVDLPRVRRNVNRCSQITKDVVTAWTAAVNQVSGDSVPAVDLVLWLSRQDRLFKKELWNKGESARLLGRIKAIPDDARNAWIEVRKAKPVDAVLAITLLDGAFDGAQFNRKAFDVSLRDKSNVSSVGDLPKKPER